MRRSGWQSAMCIGEYYRSNRLVWVLCSGLSVGEFWVYGNSKGLRVHFFKGLGVCYAKAASTFRVELERVHWSRISKGWKFTLRRKWG